MKVKEMLVLLKEQDPENFVMINEDLVPYGGEKVPLEAEMLSFSQTGEVTR